MNWPNNVYPDPPEFPVGNEDLGMGPDEYTNYARYVEGFMTDAARLLDSDGNISMAIDKGIYFDGNLEIELDGTDIIVHNAQVTLGLYLNTATISTLNLPGDIETRDMIVTGDISVSGTVTLDEIKTHHRKLSQIAAPASPAENFAVIWLSEGTGFGDNYDLCIKITEGGATKATTLVDYSAL